MMNLLDVQFTEAGRHCHPLFDWRVWRTSSSVLVLKGVVTLSERSVADAPFVASELRLGWLILPPALSAPPTLANQRPHYERREVKA